MVGQWLCGVGGGPPGLQAQQDRRDLQGGEDPDQVQRGQRSRLPNVDHDGGTWRETDLERDRQREREISFYVLKGCSA